MRTKYNMKEFLNKTGISQATLYRYINKGLIPPPIKAFNGRVFFEDSHLEALSNLFEGDLMTKKEVPSPPTISKEERLAQIREQKRSRVGGVKTFSKSIPLEEEVNKGEQEVTSKKGGKSIYNVFNRKK